jgi:hypothetical protein
MFSQTTAPAPTPSPAQTNWFSSFLPSSTEIPNNNEEQANNKAKKMLQLFKNVGYVDGNVYFPIFYNRLFGVRGMKSYKSDLEKLFFTDIYGNRLNLINLELFKDAFLKNKDKITNNITKIQTCRDCPSQWRDITDEDKNNIKNAEPNDSVLLEETFKRLQKNYSNDISGSISQQNWKQIFIEKNGLITDSELEDFFKKLFNDHLQPVQQVTSTTGGKKLRKKSKKHSKKGLRKSRKNNRKSRK